MFTNINIACLLTLAPLFASMLSSASDQNRSPTINQGMIGPVFSFTRTENISNSSLPVHHPSKLKNQSTTAKGQVTFGVHIINGLRTRVLLSHCKSEDDDDDLGINKISIGNEFSWEFTVSGATVYWCYLAPDSNSHVNIRVFWNNRHFYQNCDKYDCSWIAKDNGVFFRNDRQDIEEFVAAWKPGRLNKGY
ncbi:conserved hypothetical protein [Ricinus communis]|uniref:S-protein homolog n=1 Tax=Ricinus communis TaxID=3988 RepID=B9S7Z9_RICCO|nr:conserved hypothetical protein [Ricinus communis]|eukprot:XP_002522115.1 S-protein homolog 1 [Ricinus communis]